LGWPIRRSQAKENNYPKHQEIISEP
jgi:hypothetical protein